MANSSFIKNTKKNLRLTGLDSIPFLFGPNFVLENIIIEAASIIVIAIVVIIIVLFEKGANLMQNIPCGFLRQGDIRSQLNGGYALLGHEIRYIARNHFTSGILVFSKIVPTVTEKFALQCPQ